MKRESELSVDEAGPHEKVQTQRQKALHREEQADGDGNNEEDSE